MFGENVIDIWGGADFGHYSSQSFGGMVRWWSPSKIVSGNPDIQPTWPLLLKTEKVDEIFIFFLLNYGPIGFKLC